MNPQFGNTHILIKAEDEVKKRSKKGGLGPVFKLMESLCDLQQQIEDIKLSVDEEKIRTALGEFDAHIDEMYAQLGTIASEGLAAIRGIQDGQATQDGETHLEEGKVVKPDAALLDDKPVEKPAERKSFNPAIISPTIPLSPS